MEFIFSQFAALHSFVFEAAVQPALRSLGAADLIEEAFNGTAIFLLGLFELALIALLALLLEKTAPFEVQANKQSRKLDKLYTALHRTGGFALIVFFTLSPLLDLAEAQLRFLGLSRTSLDTLIPWLGAHMLLQFAAYLLLFDYVDYWLHRAQHRFNAWWALHSLHHAQTEMSVWSDNRNHLLDDFIRDALFAILAWLISVEPGQFVALLLLSRLLQNAQHANTRLGYGWLGSRVFVDPRFHRVHHGVSIGHLQGKSKAFGCNFGVIFPWWDMLHGTADFSAAPVATGVADQAQGRDYGQTFWRQQWLGLRRMIGKA